MRCSGKSVQIKMSKKRVELKGVKENFRKRDLGKEWNHLEENTKKETPDEVNLSHYGKKLEEMGPHHLLSLVWRWKHPTATMIWLLPDLRREINTSQLKKGEQGRCGRSGMQMFCEKPWTITKNNMPPYQPFSQMFSLQCCSLSCLWIKCPL